MKIKAGQLWGDDGRSVRIVSVRGDSATCALITDADGEMVDNAEQLSIPLQDFEKYVKLHDPMTEKDSDLKGSKQKKQKIKDVISDVSEKMDDWFQKNPIRKWLKETETSYPHLSAMVGVSVNSLHSWLTGRKPSNENVTILAAAIGMSESEFRNAWESWMKKKPKP